MMERFLDGISSYHILNCLIPGSVFSISIKLLCCMENEINISIFELAILYYFVGLVINRISSFITGKILNKVGSIKKKPYNEHVNAEKKDNKVSVLLESVNMYRSMTTAMAFLILTTIFLIIIQVIKIKIGIIACCVSSILMILFGISYIKTTKQLIERIEINN